MRGLFRRSFNVDADPFDHHYKGSLPAWVIGHAQPAIVKLADQGKLNGRMLHVGCGTGEHAMLAAERGAIALGADRSPRAIAQATKLPAHATMRHDSRWRTRWSLARSVNLLTSQSIADCFMFSGATAIESPMPGDWHR
jgi:2-polyprenyl-3-methyl-5-hydroxy-6-metoxy-1,4-benzoquinol methylase